MFLKKVIQPSFLLQAMCVGVIAGVFVVLFKLAVESSFGMVQKNLADIAVIPVENSNAGRVADVHFLLPNTGLFINGEYFLRVEHQLLGLPEAKLENIVLFFHWVKINVVHYKLSKTI